jgi:DNA-binding transcriptional LysR family regulator
MMDRLDALRLFVRAAELGSFSKAAAEAGVRQSTVSKAVAALETQWGVALFLRSTRRIALTETGRTAVERARAALDAVDGLDLELTGRDREPVGLLRVHASVALARYVLAPIAADFVNAYPHVKIDFLADDRPLDLVEAAVDIAFLLGTLEDSPHFTKRVGGFDRVLAASPAFLAAHRAPAHPDDLSQLPCVVFTTTPTPETWRLLNGTKKADVAIAGPVRANSGGIVHETMLRGVGIGFVPAFLILDDLQSGRLVRVLAQWRGVGVDVHAIWPSNRRLPGKARVFMDFVGERIAGSA